MRNRVSLIFAILTISGLSLAYAGQGKIPKVSERVLKMRVETDALGKKFADAVMARALKTGSFDNSNMGSYAKELGGAIPVNPCTGTMTGYTMTVSKDKKSASVAASKGLNCGVWTPKVYTLKLPAKKH